MKQIKATWVMWLYVSMMHSCDSKTAMHASSNEMYDSCDSPDMPVSCCFRECPQSLGYKMQIAKLDEAGEPILIEGRILQAKTMKPLSGVVMYAYHTDRKGHYSKRGDEEGAAKWHGYLHGWCRTDPEGRYEIHSIRPAAYPTGGIPAHIHAVLKPQGREAFYINDFVFKDDPMVNTEYLKSLQLQGGDGVVDLQKDDKSGWRGVRDIIIQ